MKVLIDLDEGLLSLIDAEASAAGATRLKVVRELLAEALRARAAGRGEEFPEVEPWVEAANSRLIAKHGRDVISARVNDGTRAAILSRPVRTAHEVVTGADPVSHCDEPWIKPIKSVSSIASRAQTVAEERMRDRTTKPVT